MLWSLSQIYNASSGAESNRMPANIYFLCIVFRIAGSLNGLSTPCFSLKAFFQFSSPITDFMLLSMPYLFMKLLFACCLMTSDYDGNSTPYFAIDVIFPFSRTSLFAKGDFVPNFVKFACFIFCYTFGAYNVCLNPYLSIFVCSILSRTALSLFGFETPYFFKNV